VDSGVLEAEGNRRLAGWQGQHPNYRSTPIRSDPKGRWGVRLCEPQPVALVPFRKSARPWTREPAAGADPRFVRES